ncbi:HD domain-containing protein [Embleya sp. NPDC001921]
MATVVFEQFRTTNDTANRVLGLLDVLRGIRAHLPVDQLEHALQTATLAERANASDELVLAALCHDIGKVVAPHNHGAVAAEILRPYVSPQTCAILLHHEEFRYRDMPRWTGVDPRAHLAYRDERWFATAEAFAEWDRLALDPRRVPAPLAHFEPLVRHLMAHPQTPHPPHTAGVAHHAPPDGRRTP